MRVVIVGAGDVGQALAARLAERQQVLLLDVHQDRLTELGEPVEPDCEPSASGITCVHGDGTSRLVLQRLFDTDVTCALVAAMSRDESNLEAGRVGRDIGFDPVIAVQHDSESLRKFRDARISALDRPMLLSEQLERILRHKGAIIPTGIGLGHGELVEIRLQKTSPILNRPLKRLALHRWRVAAIFRGDELIVPTGDTRLEVDDRVLLVGDPTILRTVTEYLRLGTPQFPRPFGPNVVTFELSGPDEDVQREAESLACGSGAANLVRGWPGAEENLGSVEHDELATTVICKGEEMRRGTFSLPHFHDHAFSESVRRQRPGVVVMRPQSRTLWSRILGIHGPDAEICDRIGVPVLFARRTFPFQRILLPVSESKVNILAAEMAIDITRQLGASLTAMNVDLPQYISGIPDERLHEEVVPIRRLCELYEVPLDYRHRHGNPVHELITEAAKHDLVVVARWAGRGDSYFDPDVALRIVRTAPCSVIVLTIQLES
ncbi:TrkA C-terminal domain-containing protein [Myxococcota bacterium]